MGRKESNKKNNHLTRAAWSGSTLFVYGNMIRYDPTQVDLTSNFFVLCTNMKVYLYNYSKWVEPCMNIHEGKGYCWSIQITTFDLIKAHAHSNKHTLGGSTVAQWYSAWLKTEGPRVQASAVSLRCCPWARHIYPSLVLVQPRKTRPCLTERSLMGCKDSNQTNKTKAQTGFFLCCFLKPIIMWTQSCDQSIWWCNFIINMDFIVWKKSILDPDQLA